MHNKTSELVERQVRQWEFEKRRGGRKPPDQIPPGVIALSGERGAGGSDIVALLSQALRIPVHDRDIVEHIALDRDVLIRTVEALDQQPLGLIDDHVTNFFRRRSLYRGEYLEALVRTVMALWQHGPCIFVGRGVSNIIPVEHRLAVRVVAETPRRVAAVSAKTGLGEKQAREHVEQCDHDRRSFIRHYFGFDIDDPLAYDLVVNSGQLSLEEAASTIDCAYHHQFPYQFTDRGSASAASPSDVVSVR